ncbi:hypothetical protein [Phenylobacterium montanum]|uniref:Sulfur globule protein n=1 Tax=Phenylobacterium montanum TaxID=2823693 RepID=A0A975FYV6_9CAUL|nr:hypothetical protein [Caulobacter sp. S6]QUD87504.1 hypothetical protein KCG34_21000 [Caulobacter sp. S6]
MKKILTAALAALTLGGAAVATATPASAHPWGGGWHGGGWHGGGWHGGGWHDGWRGDDAGLALGAGLAGLFVGATLADHPHYYGPGYYYGPPPAYGVCWAPRRVWDPYYGGWIVQNVRYPC